MQHIDFFIKDIRYTGHPLELYFHITYFIECKKTDTINNSRKELEWKKIETKFNSMCATARTSKMLRSKWDSLKKTTKKEYGEYKQSLYKTGGGPGSSDFKMSGYMKRILAVVRIGMSGTCSKFDCDFDLPNSSNKLLTEDSSSISSQVPIVPTEVISNEDIAAEEITIDKDSSDAAEIVSN